MKTARKFICVLLAALLSALLLSSCGASGYVGTWHCEAGDTDFRMELEKDGQVFFYQTLNDFVYTGTWDETEEGVSVSLDYTDIEMELTANGKDELQNRNWSTPPFIRTKGMEVPRTTVETLSCFYWIDSKTNMELSVYDDGSWELCDDDYNTLNEGSEDSVKINGYDIVLTSDYGGELEMELSEDGSQITGYKDMTFRCITTVGDDGDEAEEESYPEEDTESEAITKENFYGCWKNENRQFWIIFYEDFTYEMYWGEEETGVKGEYELYGEEIRLNAGPRYTPDGEGNLVDVSGDTYYPAEPPAFIYDITFDDEDSSFGDIPSYDDERFKTDESDEAYDFCGCWEYHDDDLWLCIYNDGSYEWYDEEGLYGGGSYYIVDGVLCLEQEDLTYEAKFGGLVAGNGSTLFSSFLPDYDGNDMDGAEDFIGCWEDTTDNVWLEINSDGTYLFMWDDGYGASGRCYMDGDKLCLQSGTRFYMDYENSVIVSNKYTMFRSEMPDHLR